MDNQVGPFRDDARVRNVNGPLDSVKLPINPSHRPLTRSQTGHVSGRTKHNDSPSRAKKFGRAPKKPRKSSVSSGDPPIAPVDELMETNVPMDTTVSAYGDSPSDTMIVTTPECITSASSSSTEKRGTRLRANLPTPVPNLTKRSRGRRVPARLPNEDSASDSAGITNRTYVCKVEACGKCFHRGEHLKRHIRSIHTHEKPFTCTHPLCKKSFNRHDNLLQHLKVHKDLTALDSSCANDPGTPIQLQQRGPPLTVTTPPQIQPYYATRETYDAYTSRDRVPASYLPPISSIREYAAPNPSPFEPGRFATNMAVSSLRTEILHSPYIPRSSHN